MPKLILFKKLKKKSARNLKPLLDRTMLGIIKDFSMAKGTKDLIITIDPDLTSKCIIRLKTPRQIKLLIRLLFIKDLIKKTSMAGTLDGLVLLAITLIKTVT